RRSLTLNKVPGAEEVLTGDLTSREETIELAEKVNSAGPFHTVIHNAGVYQVSPDEIFNVNTLAPYILTCLIKKPERLIYISSGMHVYGHLKLEKFKKNINNISYSDSKLHVLMLSMAVARKWSNVFSNSVDPGWVPTRMGGSGAPDDLQKGFETQTWLAVSDDEKAKVSGRYFFHKKEKHHNPEADDIMLQEKFLYLCSDITGIAFPLTW
ncbi:MAG TPA: hypothetical protein VJ963_03665, partial [Bacteroidales bacterium]|nr:hypothetical protein [Bacteroidales bacterium]